MLFHITDHNNDNTPSDTLPTETRAHEDGSYEVVFDSKNADTDYSDEGFNAYGFSANGFHKDLTNEDHKKTPPVRKNNVAIIMLIVSALLTVFSVTLSVTSFMMLRDTSPEFTISTKPSPPETFEPWINPFDTPPTDA